jgi:rhodanese-related sulfurtransferase
MNIEQLIKQQQGTIVDVRTPGEFSGGHVSGSINLPLQDLEHRMDELKNLKTPLILCCASGGRSGFAQQVLSEKGIECVNGGSWLSVNYLQSKI